MKDIMTLTSIRCHLMTQQSFECPNLYHDATWTQREHSTSLKIHTFLHFLITHLVQIVSPSFLFNLPFLCSCSQLNSDSLVILPNANAFIPECHCTTRTILILSTVITEAVMNVPARRKHSVAFGQQHAHVPFVIKKTPERNFH